jgi:hypothetical protein
VSQLVSERRCGGAKNFVYTVFAYLLSFTSPRLVVAPPLIRISLRNNMSESTPSLCLSSKLSLFAKTLEKKLKEKSDNGVYPPIEVIEHDLVECLLSGKQVEDILIFLTAFAEQKYDNGQWEHIYRLIFKHFNACSRNAKMFLIGTGYMDYKKPIHEINFMDARDKMNIVCSHCHSIILTYG